MIAKWLFSGALAFEAGSWASLLASPSMAEGMLYCVLPHAIACAMLALAVWRLLPRRYRAPLPWSVLLIFSLAFFIPLLGMVGVLAAVFPALYLQRSQGEQVWQAMGVPALPYRPQEQRRSPMFPDGGLQDVLRRASDPEQRLAALQATRRMPGHESVPILKLALRDPADDVRLLAYSMLDQQEGRINQRIEALLRELSEAAPAQQAALHAGLARWYWELAYLGLAQGSVLEHVLQQASEHLQAARTTQPNAELDLLAGRVAMEQGDYPKAQAFLQAAEDAGLDVEKVLPYQAELAFRAGRYEEVAGLLARLPEELRRRPPFADLARYWL